MKKLFKILIALFILAILGYFIIMNLPQATTKNKEAKIEIQAIKLFNDFSTNEQTANNLYNGKVIEVSGEVRNVTKDKKGATVVILKTEDMVGGVLCTFENAPKQTLNKGNQVTIKGQCSGLLMDVVLNKCNLVK